MNDQKLEEPRVQDLTTDDQAAVEGGNLFHTIAYGIGYAFGSGTSGPNGPNGNISDYPYA